MGTGFRSTFVLSWSQVQIDGLKGAPIENLSVGATWSWTGEAVCVDKEQTNLLSFHTDSDNEIRRRAAKMVRRLVGAAMIGVSDPSEMELNDTVRDNGFVITDGTKSFTATLIATTLGAPPLVMFVGELPKPSTDYWVIHHSIENSHSGHAAHTASGVICFTPGTKIRTADGVRLIEELNEGDYVQTKDNGLKQILWVGKRRITGARLFAMPQLRPIRIRAGAFGIDRPDDELLVSPEHRMLIGGATAKELFNADELLVSAKDLVGSMNVSIDVQVKQVTYIHILLEQHQILFANGLETESFHPANAALSTLEVSDRGRLLHMFPKLEFNPHSYGGYARRNLSASEAAIFLHQGA